MEATTNVLAAILEVFSSVGTWITNAVQSIIPMFYATETGLTFLGVLGVAGLAFSVIFLVESPVARAESNLCKNSV